MKRIVGALRRVTGEVILTCEDGSTVDVPPRDAARLFDHASGMLGALVCNVGGSVGELQTFQPRALRLTRAEDGLVEFLRISAINSVEAPEKDESTARAMVICGSYAHYVRETPEAIVAALGWDVAEVAVAAPEPTP